MGENEKIRRKVQEKARKSAKFGLFHSSTETVGGQREGSTTTNGRTDVIYISFATGEREEKERREREGRGGDREAGEEKEYV
jgi:hypothetical protein